MSELKFHTKRILEKDGTWSDLEADWQRQCQKYKEDFDDYACGTFAAIKDIIANENQSSGVYAVMADDRHETICQINTTGLPGYTSPVMRVRFLTFCPDIDLGDTSVDIYGSALVRALFSILGVSEVVDNFKAKHLKFHLPSPADRTFFTTLGQGLNQSDGFEVVRVQGAWLYITKSDKPIFEIEKGEKDE